MNSLSYRLSMLCGFALVASSAMTVAGMIPLTEENWSVENNQSKPGPCKYDKRNVEFDNGKLHLRIVKREGQWTCAQVLSRKSFGFGLYRFYIVGQIDKLAPNVVFGLFNYGGEDSINEVDIEFARWGDADLPNLNYTVYPQRKDVNRITEGHEFALHGDHSTHSFLWQHDRVVFVSQHGLRSDNAYLIYGWTTPPEPQPYLHIPQKAMPIDLILWVWSGDENRNANNAPSDGRSVEITIAGVEYIPE